MTASLTPSHAPAAVDPASAASRTRARRGALVLMGLSGFAGLGYQMVWTQQCALWLGFEAAAVLAVVTAFFGGLALGAIAFGGRIERSASPLRWYLACEAVIGLWGLALIVLMQPVGDAVEHWIGAEPAAWWQWTVTFGASFLLLLPASAAMGATLPAIERVLGADSGDSRDSRDSREAGEAGEAGEGKRSIAGLYAANTLGAVLGVLLATFWLVPALGLAATAGVCVVMNALCVVAAWQWLQDRRPGAKGASSGEPAGGRPSAALHDAWGLPSGTPTHRSGPAGARWTRALALLAISGLLGIGYEVVVVRVLSQLNEDTVYTFALLLAVYLVGTSIGAAGYQRWLRRWDEERLAMMLPGVLGTTCLLGLVALWTAPTLRAGAIDVFGTGFAAALGAEALLAAASFGLPTLAMGAWFSHLSAQAMGQGVAFGRALAVNTLGAAMASPLFGVVIAPWCGPKAALLLIAGSYIAAAMAGSRAGRRPSVAPMMVTASASATATATATAMVALVLMAVFGAPLAFVDLPDGAHLVSYAEGSMAAVSVVEDAAGVARLRINNRQQEGSSASLFVDGRQALLPVLLHQAPRRALFLGLGTGATSGVAAQDPSLQVDAVELLPEVIDASPIFTRALGLEAALPRLIAADARRFVRASEGHYDVIVSDNFHPARSGSGALYTREHFAAVRERLAPHGLFCQWLPLHQLDLDSLRSVTRTFLAVYPDAIAVLAANSLETPVIGLVGRRDADTPPLVASSASTSTSTSTSTLASWHARVEGAPARRDGRTLADFGLDDEFALLGGVVAGPRSLAAFAGQVPTNTDDRPIVAYLAPRLVYAPASTRKERLFEFLHQVSASPRDIGLASTDDARRLAAYWRARDRFLEAGRSARPVADPAAMLALVGEPLLEAVRLSPDFRPAYDPLLQMAIALAPRDAATARRVLTALRDAQPSRPEAALALQAMGR